MTWFVFLSEAVKDASQQEQKIRQELRANSLNSVASLTTVSVFGLLDDKDTNLYHYFRLLHIVFYMWQEWITGLEFLLLKDVVPITSKLPLIMKEFDVVTILCQLAYFKFEICH